MKFLQLFILYFFLSPLIGYSDGGILSIKTLPPEDESAEWASDAMQFRTSFNTSPILIQGGPTVEGYSIQTNDGNQNWGFLVTDPVQFLCDMNGDGKYTIDQANEIISGQVEKANRSDRKNTVVIRNILYPSFNALIPGPLTLDIRSSVENQGWGYQRKVRLAQCKTVYEGTMTVRDQTYATRLLFRSLDQFQTKPRLYIVLDTNGDGRFHPFDDLWFSGDWYASIENQLWTVKTLFFGSTAEVRLEPYTGKTGTLQLKGEGIVHICLGTPPGKPTSLSFQFNKPTPDQEMVLHLRADASYSLPVGNYVFCKIIVKPSQSEGVFYQWPITDPQNTAYSPFQIESDRVFTVWGGGPFYDKIKIIKTTPFDRVLIRNDGTYNEQHYPFIEMGYNDLYRDADPPTVSWLLQDREKNPIRTGAFVDQRATFYMPFWCYGTHYIQRVGSDNELIERTATEFEFYPNFPVVWGIPFLIFLGMAIFLLRVDRTYSSLGKLWVLVPGIAGMLWIGFHPTDSYDEREIIYTIAGTGPLVVTCILMACRAFLPNRIATVFFTALMISLATLSAVFSLFDHEYLISIYLFGGLYTLQFSVFYSIVQRNPNRWRIWLGYGIGCLPALLFLIPVVLMRSTRDLIAFGLALLFFSAFMMPLCLLTAWNSWVRNLFAQRLIDHKPVPIYEPDKTDWAA